MKRSEKITQTVKDLIKKHQDHSHHSMFDEYEASVVTANEIYIALTQLPHVNEEVSNAIYKELDFWRDVIEELNEVIDVTFK